MPTPLEKNRRALIDLAYTYGAHFGMEEGLKGKFPTLPDTASYRGYERHYAEYTEDQVNNLLAELREKAPPVEDPATLRIGVLTIPQRQSKIQKERDKLIDAAAAFAFINRSYLVAVNSDIPFPESDTFEYEKYREFYSELEKKNPEIIDDILAVSKKQQSAIDQWNKNHDEEHQQRWKIVARYELGKRLSDSTNENLEKVGGGGISRLFNNEPIEDILCPYEARDALDNFGVIARQQGLTEATNGTVTTMASYTNRRFLSLLEEVVAKFERESPEQYERILTKSYIDQGVKREQAREFLKKDLTAAFLQPTGNYQFSPSLEGERDVQPFKQVAYDKYTNIFQLNVARQIEGAQVLRARATNDIERGRTEKNDRLIKKGKSELKEIQKALKKGTLTEDGVTFEKAVENIQRQSSQYKYINTDPDTSERTKEEYYLADCSERSSPESPIINEKTYLPDCSERSSPKSPIINKVISGVGSLGSILVQALSGVISSISSIGSAIARFVSGGWNWSKEDSPLSQKNGGEMRERASSVATVNSQNDGNEMRESESPVATVHSQNDEDEMRESASSVVTVNRQIPTQPAVKSSPFERVKPSRLYHRLEQEIRDRESSLSSPRTSASSPTFVGDNDAIHDMDHAFRVSTHKHSENPSPQSDNGVPVPRPGE